MIGKIKKINKIFSRIKKDIPDCNSKAKIILYFMDYMVCKYRYHVIFEEYRQYAFYRLKHNAKKEYITEHDMLKIVPERYNTKKAREIFDKKQKFNEFFKDDIGRDFCYINGKNLEEFEKFCSIHDAAILKPVDQWCGHGVQRIELVNGKSAADLYQSLVKKYKECLIEEIVVQNEKVASLNPDSVNTIRIISMIDKKGEVHVPFASIRIGRKGSCVDNFCSGGMAAAIDVESGIIVTSAFDKDGNSFLVHPDTTTGIIGFQIPEWESIKEAVKKTAGKLPEARLVGWDAVLNKDGKVCFIEGNNSPGARTIQMPLKMGIRKKYEEILGKI